MRLEVKNTAEKWYAVQTCSRHEKTVAQHLRQRQVEYYLPLYESLRRWQDRRVEVQLPLFPGYMFVRIAMRDRLHVEQVPGLVRIVSFQGQPAPLAEEEIDVIQRCMCSGVRLEPHPYLKVGRRVRIVRGPLEGMEGIIARTRKDHRLVLSIDCIMRAMAVHVDASEVQPLR
jgi:transcription antitermination factor NusG